VINTQHHSSTGKVIGPEIRGCRSGRHKKRSIKICAKNRIPKCIAFTKANSNNLISVPLIRDSAHDARKINFALWNARSIKKENKPTVACDFVIHHHLDVFAITESWLTGSNRDNRTLADIQNTLPHFNFYQSPRLHGRGGGVAVLIRNGLHVTINDTGAFHTFESASSSFRLLVIYRPPPSSENKLTFTEFTEEISLLLESLSASSSRILLAGDFNVHVDDSNDREASVFLSILESFNLLQHVHSPTHINNHTLDLMIAHEEDGLITSGSISIHEDFPSDHSAIKCKVKASWSRRGR